MCCSLSGQSVTKEISYKSFEKQIHNCITALPLPPPLCSFVIGWVSWRFFDIAPVNIRQSAIAIALRYSFSSCFYNSTSEWINILQDGFADSARHHFDGWLLDGLDYLHPVLPPS